MNPITKGTRVRLIGRDWLEDWRGLIGTVTEDEFCGSFPVKVDQKPSSAIFSSSASARTSNVEVID